MSKVYIIRAKASDGDEKLSEKARKLFKEAGLAKCFKPKDFTAIKIHIGEPGNETYIKAPCFKGLIDELKKLETKPFLTDTSTLYTGRRHNAIDHMIAASEHGFDVHGLGIPFIAPDGIFGTNEVPVGIEGELNQEVHIASDIAMVQSILSVAHVTGHIGTCFAATLKTLGMGCASRRGKMRQHSSIKPRVDRDRCMTCGECLRHCPQGAITLEDLKSHINKDKCVGCAECLAVCRFSAIYHDWDTEIELLERNVAEHAKGVLAGKQGRAAFINFAISITSDCDCMGNPDKNIVDDIGILASTDPVAIDTASINLMQMVANKPLDKISKYPNLGGEWQVEHAELIGMGSRKYKLIEIE